MNKKLQSGEKEINLHTSRGLYNQLMSDISELSSHLAADAKIVVDKDFESVIEKIQGENEANLRPAEKRAVQFLLKSVHPFSTGTAWGIQRTLLEKPEFRSSQKYPAAL